MPVFTFFFFLQESIQTCVRPPLPPRLDVKIGSCSCVWWRTWVGVCKGTGRRGEGWRRGFYFQSWVAHLEITAKTGRRCRTRVRVCVYGGAGGWPWTVEGKSLRKKLGINMNLIREKAGGRRGGWQEWNNKGKLRSLTRLCLVFFSNFFNTCHPLCVVFLGFGTFFVFSKYSLADYQQKYCRKNTNFNLTITIANLSMLT